MDSRKTLTPSYAFEFKRLAFVINDHPNYDGTQEVDFILDAEKNAYMESLKNFSLNYHYRHKKMSYKMNYLGYRTKNFNDIDQNNFFISLGCSFTEGVGIAEDEIWCNQLSQNLGIDCFNLGKGGSGCELVYLNSFCFLKNSPVKPKFVVIQWPSYARISIRSLEIFHTCLPNDKTIYADYYAKEIESGRFAYVVYLAMQSTLLAWHLADVPVYSWSMDIGINSWTNLCVSPEPEDLEPENMARDQRHFGAGYHKRVANMLENIIGFDNENRLFR